MAAISGLQKAIMADAGNIQPELLATTVNSHKVPTPGQAVGTVYACTRSEKAPRSRMPWTN
jgi:hypothetical protein